MSLQLFESKFTEFFLKVAQYYQKCLNLEVIRFQKSVWTSIDNNVWTLFNSYKDMPGELKEGECCKHSINWIQTI